MFDRKLLKKDIYRFLFNRIFMKNYIYRLLFAIMYLKSNAKSVEIYK